MAPGVLKTFKKELKKYLKFGYEDMVGAYCMDEDTMEAMDSFIEKVGTISFDTTEFGEKLFEEAEPVVSQESFLNIVDKAYERAFAATEKATYQAMEGLVHNLNTMHSRAGAQVSH